MPQKSRGHTCRATVQVARKDWQFFPSSSRASFSRCCMPSLCNGCMEWAFSTQQTSASLMATAQQASASLTVASQWALASLMTSVVSALFWGRAISKSDTFSCIKHLWMPWSWGDVPWPCSSPIEAGPLHQVEPLYQPCWGVCIGWVVGALVAMGPWLVGTVSLHVAACNDAWWVVAGTGESSSLAQGGVPRTTVVGLLGIEFPDAWLEVPNRAHDNSSWTSAVMLIWLWKDPLQSGWGKLVLRSHGEQSP